MWKTSTLLILGSFFAGCASPQSKARDADEAQHDANQKAAYAAEDTKAKSDEIQQKANDDTARNNREGAQKGREAQSGADAKSVEASSSLANARVEARDDSEKKLTGLEKTFAELKPKLVKKLSKADYTAVVAELTDKSDAVRRSIVDLDAATADSLEPVKSTITRRLGEFQRALEDATKRA